MSKLQPMGKEKFHWVVKLYVLCLIRQMGIFGSAVTTVDYLLNYCVWGLIADLKLLAREC
ncbi:hypothetical protein DNQ77_17150 [Escherichia coli]|nr:hypothetical protein [Escherichia coli]